MGRYDYKQVEKEVRSLWKKKKTVEKIAKFNPKAKKFYLLDGPPYSNGHAHVGHIKNTTFKDIWGRLRYMQGHSVWFLPGFDCHGLPIENKVEKLLQVKSKQDIEGKIGLDKFMKKCLEFANGNIDDWLATYRQLGAVMGWNNSPYKTYTNDYIESGWWTVKKLHEKGMLTEGTKPIFWCPSCQTALSGYEVTDSYKDVEDPSIYVKFKVKGTDNEYLLIWTTTPWTLPANVAIVAHPDETYVKVDIDGEILIMAEKLMKTVLEKEEITRYKVKKKFKGKELDGLRYEPSLNLPIQEELDKDKKAHRVLLSIPLLKKKAAGKLAAKKETKEESGVTAGHFVTMDTGSGLVHCAPGHGAEDNTLGKHYGIPAVSPVDEAGKLMEGTGALQGVFVKDADKLVVEYLEAHGLLYHYEPVVHPYPLCWRCKDPLVYRLSKQWFFSVDSIKQKMIKGNKKINWLPDFGKTRFGNWLDNAQDWCISQQRFWGIPMPVWLCDDCGALTVIGSREELEKKAVGKVKKGMDLHKNEVDKIKVKCDACGKKATRVPDIMNVWFDSGIAPWASLGYPYQNKELFETLWPVDQINEAQDQIRGWFYALVFFGMATFDEMPYKGVSMVGWTLDKKGEKMSKSLGNIVSAEDALGDLGADLLRLYYCWDVAPWEVQKFDLQGAKEILTTMNVLTNMLSLCEMYGLKSSALSKKPAELAPVDQWLNSKLNRLVRDVTDDIENFRLHFAGRKLVDFILNDFSRWYVKVSKERLGGKGPGKDAAEHMVMKTLNVLSKLMAPITPFMTENIYQTLFAKQEKCESVHMCEYPRADVKAIDDSLEKQMDAVEAIVENVNSLRQAAKIKLRWPVAEVAVETKDKDAKAAVKTFGGILESLCNSKKVRVATTKDKKSTWEEAKVEFGKVYLETKRDKALMEEAMIRELNRTIQVMRKKAGKKMSETIEVYLSSDKATEKTLEEWKDTISSSTGSKAFVCDMKGKNEGALEFEGKKVRIRF